VKGVTGGGGEGGWQGRCGGGVGVDCGGGGFGGVGVQRKKLKGGGNYEDSKQRFSTK